jgi:rhomboid protease GluP
MQGWQCTLYDFQAKYTYAISNKYEVWRLITPIFLHQNWVHLFWNVFSLFMIGFVVESEVRTKANFVTILLLGGIAGNLFSAWAKPYSIGVGASASIFALLGVLIIWVWLHFHEMGPYRFQFLAFFLALLLISVVQNLAAKQLDFAGHAGGLIIGACLGVKYLVIDRAEDQQQ